MLITVNNILELNPMLGALKSLPTEGKDLNEVINREYARAVSIGRIEEHIQANKAPTTILVDDYWGYKALVITQPETYS